MSRYKLFIGHLSPDCRTKDLERFFKDHGFSKSITEVVVKTGYGFVLFDDRRDADDAIYELNGKELLNSQLQVEYAKQSEPRGGRGYVGGFRDDRDDRRGGDDRGFGSSRYGRPYNTDFRLIVENLSTRCSWQDIKDYFRQAGEVTFAKCHREKMGEGVVEFATAKDMNNALRKLDGTELFGKRLKLCCENPDHRDSRSRSRSRSPRGGGGRSRSPQRRSYSRSPRRSPSRTPSPRR